MAREGSPPRLTKNHVRAINNALAAVFAASSHGSVELVIVEDRIDEIHTGWSAKFRGDGAPDALLEELGR